MEYEQIIKEDKERLGNQIITLFGEKYRLNAFNMIYQALSPEDQEELSLQLSPEESLKHIEYVTACDLVWLSNK